MTSCENLNLNQIIPIQNKDGGPYLIEASAGTGKTFSITYLFLHAIIQNIPLDKILIMTFTDAATSELRERIIRSINLFSQELAENNSMASSSLAYQIVKTYQEKYFPNDNNFFNTIQQRLSETFSQLDFLQIYTIHGFCRKVLSIHAFESNIDFSFEICDDNQIFNEISLNERRFLLINQEMNADTETEINKDFQLYLKLWYTPSPSLQNVKYIESYKRMRKAFFEYKEKRNLISYDDMINLVYNKIIEKDSSLTQILKKKYQIVMLDEFQDTDEKQLKIFTQIFTDQDHGMFMIGDPKQSIYEFRGANLDMYFESKNNIAKKLFTLNNNYRSSAQIVESVNKLFSRDNSFGQGEKLIFSPTISGKKDGLKLKLKNQPEELTGMVFCQKQSKEENIKTTIEEIKFLYQNAYFETISKQQQPLCFNDITILVGKNNDAKKIVDLLHFHQIPAVLKSTCSVFSTIEAKEFYALLNTIINFSESTLRQTLFSTFYLLEPDVLQEQSATFKQILTDISPLFLELKLLWQKKGITTMWYYLMNHSTSFQKMKTKAFIASQNNGKRKIVNFEHIIELLYLEEVTSKLSPERILTRLGELIQSESNTPTPDTHIIRLDNDLEAVQVVTMHSSKGLEYPIVFCLDLSEVITYKNIDKAPENLREFLRLTYVTLTRAKNRNYIFLNESDNKNSYISPIFYLLLRKNGHFIDFNNFCSNEFCRNSIKSKDLNIDFQKDIIQTIKDFQSPYITLWEPNPTPQTDFKPRENAISLQKPSISKPTIISYDISSFSSLTSNIEHINYSFEKKEDDEFEEITEEENILPTEIYALPKGAIFGKCVHHIFENYFKEGRETFWANERRFLQNPMTIMKDFQKSNEEEKQKKVNNNLIFLKQMIINTLNNKLIINNTPFQLANITPQNAKVELEFFYQILNLKKEYLINIFRKHHKEELASACENLRFDQKQGFMTGFIDLLFRHQNQFFIVDWKTNFLGGNDSFYTVEKIKTSVINSWYFLQYHIYCLALDLFLKQTLIDYDYEKHFGGVFYIYVRGCHDNNGVFFDRPSKSLIEELEKVIVISNHTVSARNLENE